MLLSGYGVELAIKSTEYKAVDDAIVTGQPSTGPTLRAGLRCFQGDKTEIFFFFGSADSKTASNVEDDNQDEVQGFLFGVLKLVL